jgi:hypothetical protein
LTLKNDFTNPAPPNATTFRPTISMSVSGTGAYDDVLRVKPDGSGTLTNRGLIKAEGNPASEIKLLCALTNAASGEILLTKRFADFATRVVVEGKATTTHVSSGKIVFRSDVAKDPNMKVTFKGSATEPFNNANGTIEGSGTIDVRPGKLRAAGRLDPKKVAVLPKSDSGPDDFEPLGAFLIEGDYEEDPAASIRIELATPDSPGDTHDQIEVTGSATLAGQLEAAVLSGYIPAPSDSFEVFRADGGRSGFFSNASSIVDAGVGTFAVVYTATSVWLTNFQPSTAVEQTSWGSIKSRFQ